MEKATVLVCDDEVEILRYLKKILTAGGVETGIFSSGSALLDHLAKAPADCNLVLLDVKMPDMDGIEVLQRIKKIRPELPVVIMTAYGSIGSAVDAMKVGAYDYVAKPFPKEKVLGLLEKVLERERLLQENSALKEALGHRPADTIVYASEPFREVMDLAKRVAASEANALILGESGTGKELVARLIHDKSPRKGKRFVSINCAALPDTLLESQLFGHVKGAFTGALGNQRGLLEEADGGTLFLDEVGDMSRSTQAKVLRVVQERDFIPVGGTKPKSVDIRIVAATNKDLEEEARQGNFREDLYFRLNVITLKLPPLRERREDIALLARHFLKKFSQRINRELVDFTDEALKRLTAYSWPGNVRELQNAIERATILAKGDLVTADVLPGWKLEATDNAPQEGRLVPLETVERDHIRYVLKQTGNNKSRAALILGIGRRTLDRKLEEYQMETGAGGPGERS